MRLDIFSDPICPWCMIGKAHLERALEARASHTFEVEWHPFQLNPDMPADGVDRRQYLEVKFGGKDRAVEIYARVEAAAKAAGVAIDFAAIPRVPNTLNAHRLIHWAGQDGKQNAAVAALFRAYWQQGRDIGDAEVLAEIAAECGLDRAVVARLLASDADLEVIVARDAHARTRGVNAVPTFVLADQYVLSGAQGPELWLQVIDELAAQSSAAE
jgi:predicted DsbA family dithiol-disulfide isomerase